MKRRHFILTGLAAGAAPPLNAAFAPRSGPARLHLSLAAYTFRKRFGFMRGKPQDTGGPPMNMFDFLDYCARHRCIGAELTSYFFPPDADAAYFRRLKHHAFLRGVEVSGTAIGNDFSTGDPDGHRTQVEDAKAWIEKAALLGAPHVRFFAGTARGFAGGPQRIDQAVAALRECAALAASHGIFIGIENHGAITTGLLLDIVKAVDSKWIGINLDSGNFISDDPYADFARCAPLAVNVQIKTTVKKGVEADFPRLVKILRDARYQGYVVLEYEGGNPDREVPDYLARLAKLLSA